MSGCDSHRNDASWSVLTRAIGPFLLAVLASCRLAAAQCPDGSPPPCAEARPAPPDPRRIAILPFRIRAADTLLNEGIPELIATEFTGEVGPRAVHLGTVLRAWRRAGGSLRRPLEPAEMQRVAREVDAGLVVDGSAVGLGTRLTLSATVIAVPGGAVRPAGSVSGPADSVEVLIGRLTSGIMAAAGAEHRSGAQTSLTGSPEAMRAYLQGLAHFRANRMTSAAGAFERALGLDSSFARAAMMRFIAAGWIGEDVEVWARLTWARRARLSAADRTLLTASLGDHYPDARSPEASLADLREAVSQLPESPEAHHDLADYLYHSGGANSIVDPLGQARAEFERSLALDTQATVLQHLVDVALYTADTAGLRRYWPAFDRAAGSGPGSTSYGIVVAERTGDTSLAAAMARRFPNLDFVTLQQASMEAAVSVDRLAQRYDQQVPVVDDAERARRDRFRAYSLLSLGHPSLVRAIRSTEHDEAIAAALDRVLLLSALLGDGDSTEAAGAAARLAAVTLTDSTQQAGSACVRSLWALHNGAMPQYDPAFLGRQGWRVCAALLDLLQAARTDATDVDARLVAADSLLRWDIANVRLESHHFENLILARLWEQRGRLDRAIAAARSRHLGFGTTGWIEAVTAREEGRLAALTGDTVGAIRAYRRYLDFRRDAEPALIPQRDSVRAEVTRLTASGRE